MKLFCQIFDFTCAIFYFFIRTLDVYGKVIQITDCDDFTREFYKRAHNIDQGPQIPHPADTFALARAEIDADNIAKMEMKKAKASPVQKRDPYAPGKFGTWAKRSWISDGIVV